MLANNIHQAVVNGGYTTLLSGFGGDECVSGHAFMSGFLPEMLRRRSYKQSWYELQLQHKIREANTSSINYIIDIIRFSHPCLFSVVSKYIDLKKSIKDYLKLKKEIKNNSTEIYYKSVRHQEYDLLQGLHSHHVRMRVEYSAICQGNGF